MTLFACLQYIIYRTYRKTYSCSTYIIPQIKGRNEEKTLIHQLQREKEQYLQEKEELLFELKELEEQLEQLTQELSGIVCNTYRWLDQPMADGTFPVENENLSYLSIYLLL